MAGLNQTFTTTIKDDASRVVATETHTETGDSLEEFNVSCPGSSNVVVPLTVDVSTVTAFWIVSDGAVALTENDDGSPDLGPISLVANVPYWWFTGKGTNPFTVDVTSLKFTKATAGAATVKGAFLTT